MSGRGRGGGGRRSDAGRGQQAPSPAPSSSQGRGGVRGRAGGGGRGQGYPDPPSTSIVPPASTSPGGQPSPRPQSSSSVWARPHAPAPARVTVTDHPAPARVTVTAPPAPAPVTITAPPDSTSVSESVIQDMERLQLEPKDSPVKLPPASSKALRVPSRPGYGRVGQKCVVKANHFVVGVADKDLYQYDVAIRPEVTSKKFNRDIMNQLVNSYRESHLGKRTPAYDGQKSLYTAGRLPFESKEFVVTIVENEGQAGSSNPRRRERQFKVTIKLASRPDLHHLQEFLRGRHAEAPQETIQVLDVVLRATPSEKYVVAGRSFFSPVLGDRGSLADGIEYWKGFYQSLRPTQMGLSLNIDISARSFYEPILVTEFILEHFNRRDFSRPFSDQERLKVKKALKGVKVVPVHLGYPRSYKISGISREGANKISFTLDDQKTKMNVAQYFREKYNVVLRYPSLPALQAGTEAKPVYLPMELCRISDGQRYTKKLNEKQVTALLRATCQRPNARENDIKEMVRRNNFNRNELVNEFGIQVASELAVVEARVLPPPMLKYHETGKQSTVNPKVGQWNMIDKKMVNGGKVDNWACINFSERVDPRLPSTFCEELVNMCISKGMIFNPKPVIPIIARGNHSNIDASLRDVKRQTQGKLGLQLLIVILPDFTGSYGTIKRVCETDLGIVTQCCKPQQAYKLSKQYLENLSLKINVKVGGRNTVLIDALQKRIPLLTDRPTIIFGADVTHPQAGDDYSPSIAAVVASMDWPEVTKYRSIVAAQAHREEIIMDLFKDDAGSSSKGIIWELLRAFYRSVGQKPHRIIFYRDGVSEGQFSQVLLHEVSAIQKACATLEEGYAPHITFIVVQKRHHTRLFPTDRNMTDRSGNILPGTVVDTKICHPTEFDFYLNSHAGIQGTSRPTHYHILYDDNGFTADGVQMLTNALCYTYARCTRSVSIVPPAYYAHLAAFRARYYIEGEASDIGSTNEGRSVVEGNVEVRSLPGIKDNVKEFMFYC